jgi:hypothetical protein
MQVIPIDRFDEYWAHCKLIGEDLKKYGKLLQIYDDAIYRLVSGCICNVKSYIRHLYGCKIPVVWYGQKDYKKLLDIYETYKEEYELPFPGFPKEYLLAVS